MAVYLLKSGACMAILLLFYKLLLEKENMHVLKRFFLLGALVVSLTIPALVFTEFIEMAPATNEKPMHFSNQEIAITENTTVADTKAFNWKNVLWPFYFLGVVLFGFRFAKHLFQIVQRIRKNPRQRVNFTTWVLLQEKMPPHTFFKYIFLNKEKLENNAIPNEIIIHEETHAKQRHSLDVLFIELLQVIFWFNPLLFLFKKSIKLNHEFLADHAVLKKNVGTGTYQNTLLSYLSREGNYDNQSINMANAIYYSSIKKRFTVMKTQTSKKAMFIRSLLLLPLLAILLYGFSETKTIFTPTSNADRDSNLNRSMPQTNEFENTPTIKDSQKRIVELAGLILNSETLRPLRNVEIHDSKGNILSTTDDRGYYKARFDNLNQEGEISFEYALSKDGYRTLLQKEHWGNLEGKIESVAYFGLQKRNSKALEFSESVSHTKNLSYESIIERFPLVKERFEFNKKLNIAKKDNQHILIKVDNVHYLVNNTGCIKVNSKDDLISIDGIQIIPAYKVNDIIKRKDITGMTPLENHRAQYAIYTINQKNMTEPLLPEYPTQEGATKLQLKEYNALAKKYNQMSRDNFRVIGKEVERLEYLHSLMSEEQREKAEPFPDFPSPPPTPATPKAVKGTVPPPTPNVYKTEIREVPPPPKSPIEHIREMAQQNALFYFEGKKISAEKAIDILEKSNKISVRTQHEGLERPTVELSTSPIVLEN